MPQNVQGFATFPSVRLLYQGVVRSEDDQVLASDNLEMRVLVGRSSGRR